MPCLRQIHKIPCFLECLKFPFPLFPEPYRKNGLEIFLQAVHLSDFCQQALLHLLKAPHMPYCSLMPGSSHILNPVSAFPISSSLFRLLSHPSVQIHLSLPLSHQMHSPCNRLRFFLLYLHNHLPNKSSFQALPFQAVHQAADSVSLLNVCMPHNTALLYLSRHLIYAAASHRLPEQGREAPQNLRPLPKVHFSLCRVTNQELK